MNRILLSLAAAAVVAAGVASPALANGRKGCDSNTETALVGAAVGALLGGAVGSGTAAPGYQTDNGMIGALLGGVAGLAAGSALGDGDCKSNRYAAPGYSQYPGTHYPAPRYDDHRRDSRYDDRNRRDNGRYDRRDDRRHVAPAPVRRPAPSYGAVYPQGPAYSYGAPYGAPYGPSSRVLYGVR